MKLGYKPKNIPKYPKFALKIRTRYRGVSKVGQVGQVT